MHTVLSMITKRFNRTTVSSISINHQILFFKRASYLLSKGYPFLDVLEVITWDDQFKQHASNLMTYLKQGSSVDTAFYKAGFSAKVISFLYFGRFQRDLQQLFSQCSEMLTIQEDYTIRFKRALRYPILLLFFLFATFYILKQAVFPSFFSMLSSGDTSSFALYFIYALDGFITALVYVGVLIVIALIGWLLLQKRLSLQQRLNWYQRVPLYRGYYSHITTFYFTTHFSSLLATGFTLNEALEMMKQQSHYRTLSLYASRIQSGLRTGQTLSQSVQACYFLRPEITTIFHKTSDITTITRDLRTSADMTIAMTKEKMEKWVQLIQPLFFIFIAGIIVMIYASIMLPIYQWMEQI
ncbi:type II secretion system F family protein [Thalassobacillus sp. CUG 92003]|uniref:type II secretion system F family protein n=1 Tax=Thalassobacillus sp. CUG 92003 TaxID=2736641 RepID=UPI0015E7C46C|nr:type II secretion system F family protein [Thalassobacillus sp. CUG 92003]